MRIYVKYGVATVWLLATSLFLYELYQYAFVEDMGLQPALMMFGEELQRGLMSFGIYSPLLFMILYAVRPLVMFPASVMTLTSVFLFGVTGGLIISYIGELFSAVIAFAIGKYFGKNFGIAEKIAHTRVGKYLSGNAFMSVFMLRLVPIFPFDVVNYASGIARLPFKDYILATMVGVIPGLSSYIFLGYSLVHTEYLLSALFIFIALLAISHYTKRYIARKYK